MPLASIEGLTYLEFIGKQTNECLASSPLAHLTRPPKGSSHEDAAHHSIAVQQMEGRFDHHLHHQKYFIKNNYEQEFLMASSDPDVSRYICSQALLSHLFSISLENGEQITETGNKVLKTNHML